MNEFKKLLGEAISDETATALQSILETKLNAVAESHKSEVDSLKDEIKTISEAKDKAEQDVINLAESLDVVKVKADEYADQVKADTIADLTESHDIAITKLKEQAEAYATKVKTEAITELTEKAEAYATKVKTDTIAELTEKAEAYAEKVKEDTIAEMTEKADAYGDYLQERAEAYAEKVKTETINEMTEKADAYGDYLQEQAEVYAEKVKNDAVVELTEQAEAYGEYLQERAEAYGVFLIAEADTYTNQQIALVEARAIEQAETAINEFKEEHLAMFDRIDEHNRMTQVFKNLKSLVEASGFSLDESQAMNEMESQLREANNAKRQSRIEKHRADRELAEVKEELKELKVKEIVESIGQNLAFTDKERIVNAVLKTNAETVTDLTSVVKTLVENTTLNKNNNERATTSVLTEDDLHKTVKSNHSPRML